MTPSTTTETISCTQKNGRWERPLFQSRGLFRFEAALDPVGRLHLRRRVDLVGAVVADVGEGDLAPLQLGCAVGGVHDRLVALAVRHLHDAARALEGEAGKRVAELLVRR